MQILIDCDVISEGTSVQTVYDLERKKYITIVKTPETNGGMPQETLNYDDADDAKNGHQFWTQRFVEQKSGEIRRCEIRITILALLKILYSYMGEKGISIAGNIRDASELTISCLGGSRPGKVVYNLKTMSITSATIGWFALIESYKDDALDKQIEDSLKHQCLGI